MQLALKTLTGSIETVKLGGFIGEKDFWDKGYGTDYVKTVVKYSFKVLGLHRVWLRVFSFNKRAIK